MRAGDLRHLVSLQARTTSRHPDTGAVTSSWVEVAQVWAAIEPLSAREFVASQSVQSQVSTRITIRHMAGVTSAMRIVHGADVYNITGVLPDRRGGQVYLTLPCSVGVAGSAGA